MKILKCDVKRSVSYENKDNGGYKKKLNNKQAY